MKAGNDEGSDNMSWAKSIDRSKFPLEAWVMTSWNANARKWFCVIFASQDDDTVLAAGQGDDPLEAMLSACIDIGALSEKGEWR